jgi:hypothetical protein
LSVCRRKGRFSTAPLGKEWEKIISHVPIFLISDGFRSHHEYEDCDRMRRGCHKSGILLGEVLRGCGSFGKWDVRVGGVRAEMVRDASKSSRAHIINDLGAMIGKMDATVRKMGSPGNISQREERCTR